MSIKFFIFFDTYYKYIRTLLLKRQLKVTKQKNAYELNSKENKKRQSF